MADIPTADPQALRAAVDRGFELHETGELDAALAYYDELLATAPVGDDPVTVESRFAARFDRAVVLVEAGELELAADAFAAAADGLPTGDPDVAHEIAMAEVNRGICLGMLDRHDEALTVYAAVVGRFPELDDDPVLREQVTRAMVNRCAALEVLGRRREAVAAADTVLDHLAGIDDLWVEEQRELVVRTREAALAPADG